MLGLSTGGFEWFEGQFEGLFVVHGVWGLSYCGFVAVVVRILLVVAEQTIERQLP
ncbi:hypothetical protein [Vibrio tasmaniensis]|uniref:hypothetical protein n=1 Tax=Vibrio tasmaniensis TaxID=212663 RepID=UPI0002E90173|nr:hypothetical protein [Vibrio tasmaniensis]